MYDEAGLHARIAKALDPNTPEDEAGREALMALKIAKALRLTVASPPKKHRGRTIRSHYAGTCRVCSEPFDEGDEVQWKKYAGSVHPECRDKWFM